MTEIDDAPDAPDDIPPGSPDDEPRSDPVPEEHREPNEADGEPAAATEATDA